MRILLISTLLFSYSTLAEEPDYGSATTPYIEASRFDRVSSLTRNNDVDENGCYTLNTETDIADGHRVRVEKSYSGNYMYTHSLWFPNPGIWSAVGLGPTLNRYVLFFGTAFGENGVREFKGRTLPFDSNNLSKWNVGDAVFWNSEGGAILGLGSGMSPLNLGTNLTVKGSWAQYVEKTGENKVFVSLIKRKIRTVSISAGVLYAGASLEKIKEKLKSRSYEVEFIDQAHFDAYTAFLRGDESKLKSLIAEGSTSIEPIEVISTLKYATERAIGIATPIVPIISWRNSRRSSSSYTHGEASWGTVRDEYLAEYVWQRNTRILHLDYLRESKFLAGKQVAIENDYENGGKKTTEKYIFELNYKYESDHGKDNRLRSQLYRFKGKTGMYNVCVNIPNIVNRVGYNTINQKAVFSEAFTKTLLNKLKDKSLGEVLISKADKIVTTLLAEDERYACGRKDYNSCYESFKSWYLKSVSYLVNGYKNYVNSDFNSIQGSNYLSYLGKTVVNNPILYRALIEEGKLCGMELTFEISGRNISMIEKKDVFTESNGCFKL